MQHQARPRPLKQARHPGRRPSRVDRHPLRSGRQRSDHRAHETTATRHDQRYAVARADAARGHRTGQRSTLGPQCVAGQRAFGVDQYRVVGRSKTGCFEGFEQAAGRYWHARSIEPSGRRQRQR